MLSHENVIACVSSVCLQLGEHRPHRNDVMISFLPLAHMLEHCCQVMTNSKAFHAIGARIKGASARGAKIKGARNNSS